MRYTLECHRGSVASIAFSHDSTQVASASASEVYKALLDERTNPNARGGRYGKVQRPEDYYYVLYDDSERLMVS